MTDEQKNDSEFYEDYISSLNQIGIKATTAADAEKALGTELSNKIIIYQKDKEALDIREKALKKQIDALDELKAARDRASSEGMKGKQYRKYIKEFEDAYAQADAAVKELGTSEEDLAIRRRNLITEQADINKQMTPQGNGGGGGHTRKDIALPGKTAADMQKFIDWAVKMNGEQWLRTPYGAKALEELANRALAETESDYQKRENGVTENDVYLARINATKAKITRELADWDLPVEDDAFDALFEDLAQEIEEGMNELPDPGQYGQQLLDAEKEAQDKANAELMAQLEAQNQLWDGWIQNVQYASDIFGNLSDAVSGWADNMTAAAQAQLNEGKITEEQFKKTEARAKNMKKVATALAIGQVTASSAAGITDVWRAYALEKVANAETAAATGPAAAATLAALNTKSLVAAILQTAGIATSGLAQLANIRSQSISASASMSASMSAATTSAPPVVKEIPTTYVKNLTSAEQETNLNVTIAQSELEASSRQVSIRQEQTTF